MSDDGYKDRQNLEIFAWPELMQTFTKLVEQVMVCLKMIVIMI